MRTAHAFFGDIAPLREVESGGDKLPEERNADRVHASFVSFTVPAELEETDADLVGVQRTSGGGRG